MYSIIKKSLNIQRKTALITVLFLSFIFIGMFICYSISASIPVLIEKQQTASLGARLLFVAPQDDVWKKNELENLKNHNHVELIFSQDEGYWSKTIETDKGNISATFLGATGSILPENMILGTNNELSAFEIIVPSIIVSSDGTSFSGETLINKKLPILIESKTYIDANYTIDPDKTTYHKFDLTVVGVYDVTSQVYLENQIFISMDTIKYLQQLSYNNLYDYIEKSDTVLVLVDDYKNVDSLSLKLKSEGHAVTKGLLFDYALLYGIQYTTAAICLLILALSCFIAYLVLKRNIIKCRTDIGILKILGYENKTILKAFAMQTFSLIAIALIIAIIGYGVIYPLINAALFRIIYLPIFSAKLIMGILAIFIILPSITILLLAKQLTQLSPIKILRDAI